MSNESVLAYLAAHQRYEKADKEWRAIRDVVNAAATRLTNGLPVFFDVMIAQDPRLRSTYRGAADAATWPTAERITQAQKEREAARVEATKLWSEISEDGRAGLQRPPQPY